MVLAWKARLKKQPSFLNTKGRVILILSTKGRVILNLANPSTADRLLEKCKAVNTLKNYDSVIKKLEHYAEETGRDINPVFKEVAVNFVCFLADKQTH